jgi:hypothetical protein
MIRAKVGRTRNLHLIPGEEIKCFYLRNFYIDPGAYAVSYKTYMGRILPGIKRPEREANLSHPI